MIRITDTIALDEKEIQEEFIRASGPGGQNINKVSSAVQLRFDVVNSHSLPGEVRDRLIKLAGRRITSEGILIIEARRLRTQEGNRRDALDRLIQLIRLAVIRPKVRHKTKPTLASKRNRLESKSHRSQIKSRRRPPSPAEE